ncbi:MAG: MBOAT family O-acyltransferase [Cyanobacteria bacterium P01_H01_bin.15]
MISILTNYCAAKTIQKTQKEAVRKQALIISIVVNLGILFFFKYYDFFRYGVLDALRLPTGIDLGFLLPIGISFYTFQSLSCTVDVYRGDFDGDYSLLDYALYISFFPQLVAGPIMRAADLTPQFSQQVDVEYRRMMSGVLLIIWGLIKKVLIADAVSNFVNTIYAQPGQFSGQALLMGTYAFALQIYMDFSAYTDIARGTGRLLGIELMENFKDPYLARNLRDFWRRWHISLSTWLRDYLYIPLGGNRKGTFRTYANLLTTMLLGGLWHGAAWTFVIWGGLHGLYLVFERLLGFDRIGGKERSGLMNLIAIAGTFHLVCITWIFFRAETFGQALAVVNGIFRWREGQSVSWVPALLMLGLVIFQAVRQALLDRQINLQQRLIDYPVLARWSTYISLVLLIVAISGSASPDFIYFQF